MLDADPPFRPARLRDGYLALEDMGLIGDGTTSALVGLDGSVVWLCLPRFDSEPLFCCLLDHARGGGFIVAPDEVVEARQRYEPDTATLIGRSMAPRWLPIVCATVLVAGCGSSSGSEKASSDATATTTATPTVHRPQPRPRRLAQAPQPTGNPPSSQGAGRDAFLRAVFDDAQALWHQEFQGAELTYRPARLTIFSQQVHTACGPGAAETGPFYCPASFGVYLDPTFFAALSRAVGVRIGDFAQAYVIGHELGHHVQTLLGITHQKAAADQQDPAGKNARSVLFELQADCLAGVWVHSVYRRGQLTEADIRDALNAAAVVGDDLMKELGQTLPEGGAALFVLVRQVTPDKVIPRISEYGGKILQTSLSNESEERLQEALDASATAGT